MLVCLVCPKPAHIPATHVSEHSDGAVPKSCTAAASPSKEHIKSSFTTQLKDIVMKFSTGAYRHCRPCTAAAVRGGVVDDDHTIYEHDDEKSSILVTPNSQERGMSVCRNHGNVLHDEDDKKLLGFLPKPQKKGHHRHKKKMKKSQKSKQSPDSMDVIEQLLNAHFQREEQLLAEERSEASKEDDDDGQLWTVESRECKLLDEAVLVTREHHVEDDNGCCARKDRKHVNGEPGNSEEWIAQVEPGVMITFVALPDGSNHLKRIRFSQDLFSKWQAQRWWAENSEMVRELYSVSKSDHNDNNNGRMQKEGSASSSRSSSSSSSSSSHVHSNALKTTPVMQSSEGSSQSSPCQTSPTETSKADEAVLPSSHIPLSHFLGRNSHEIMEHHENPLFDRPEFELCYHEGAKSPLIMRSGLWMCEQMGCLTPENEDKGVDGYDGLGGGLVRELKRVRFTKQPSWTAT